MGLFALIGGATIVVGLLTRDTESEKPDEVVPPASQPISNSRSALIVVDVQADFWIPEIAGEFPHFEQRTAELLATCRGQKIEVVHVRTRYDKDLANWPDAFLNIHRSSQLCREDTAGEEPLSCALELEGEALFRKANLDPFTNDGFTKYLKDSGFEKLYVCGLYTDVCVLTTAMSAFNRGYKVSLVPDCCASTRSTHDFTLNRYGDFIFSVEPSTSLNPEPPK